MKRFRKILTILFLGSVFCFQALVSMGQAEMAELSRSVNDDEKFAEATKAAQQHVTNQDWYVRRKALKLFKVLLKNIKRSGCPADLRPKIIAQAKTSS